MHTHRTKTFGILQQFKILHRFYAKKSSANGVVIGVYDNPESDKQEFSEAGERLNEQTNGALRLLLDQQHIKMGKAVLYSETGVGNFNHIALANIGPKNPNKINTMEQLNEEKENIRIAMASGARVLQDEGVHQISVDGATVPEAAAEGSILGTYKYNADLSDKDDKFGPIVDLYDHQDRNSWLSGEINAEAQNWARYLSHAPPNLKVPIALASEISDKLCRYDVKVDIRNRMWMAQRKMTATLSLINSMCEPPILLDIGYCGDDIKAKPIVMIGKGNIFDSGGLFLKPYKGITEFRADMSGAAAIAGAIQAIARKRLPINIRGVLLIYQNMPSPMGLKPGDVVKDKRGVTIRISNPDNDCRVVLADLLSFSDYYSPSLIIDVGTFTQSVCDTLGTGATGIFTTTHALYNEAQRAALETGDRVWRFPLWKYFSKKISAHRSVDLDNGGGYGDTCLAAAFMKKFAPREGTCCCPEPLPFMHFDSFGTGMMSQTDDEAEPYYRKGIKMGRPLRTLVQLIYHRACLMPKTKEALKALN